MGGGSDTDKVVPQNHAITLPAPTRSGYNLEGWYSDETFDTRVGDGGSSFTVTDEVTDLYARWISKNVKFKFLPGEGASGTMANATVTRSSGSSGPSGKLKKAIVRWRT